MKVSLADGFDKAEKVEKKIKDELARKLGFKNGADMRNKTKQDWKECRKLEEKDRNVLLQIIPYNE